MLKLFQERYEQLSSSLSGVDLLPLNEKALLYSTDFLRPWQDGLFLGRWTSKAIVQLLEATKFFERWREQGHHQIWLDIPKSDIIGRSELLVWTDSGGFSEILMHAVVWLEYCFVHQNQRHFPSLCVEKLRLQNPLSNSTKALLPGQNYPSAGLSQNAFALFRTMSSILGAQMLCGIPQYFHTAAIFSKAFSFIDPDMYVLFKAMKRDLLKNGDSAKIAEVSHLFETRRILRNKIPYLWPTELQAYVEDSTLREQILLSEESSNLFSSLYNFSVLTY
ncbi:MAG: hypothetical protein WC966_00680 [Bradymonadales bacterium]|jgi:hypothetical protein